MKFHLLGVALFFGCACFGFCEEANERIIVTFCPKNIRRVSDGFGSAVVSWKLPEFLGKSDTTRIRVFPSKQAGKPFPVGETAVSYKAIDDYGNEAWCNFTVTVVEGVCGPPSVPKDGTLACLEVKGVIKICAKVCQTKEGALREFKGLKFCSNRGKWVHVKMYQEEQLKLDEETVEKASCDKVNSLEITPAKIKNLFVDFLKMETPFCWYEPEKSRCFAANIKIITYY